MAAAILTENQHLVRALAEELKVSCTMTGAEIYDDVIASAPGCEVRVRMLAQQRMMARQWDI